MTIVYKIQFHSNKQISSFEHSVSPKVHSYHWIYIQRISKKKKLDEYPEELQRVLLKALGSCPPTKKWGRGHDGMRVEKNEVCTCPEVPGLLENWPASSATSAACRAKRRLCPINKLLLAFLSLLTAANKTETVAKTPLGEPGQDADRGGKTRLDPRLGPSREIWRKFKSIVFLGYARAAGWIWTWLSLSPLTCRRQILAYVSKGVGENVSLSSKH